MKDNLLSIHHLNVRYSSDKRTVYAVNDVSLELGKGQTLGLVGETGAGKTSIAKAVLRILPDVSAEFTAEAIEFDGTDIMKLSVAEMQKIRGEKISMIFQDPMTALNPVWSVGRQIADVIALHNKSLGKKEAWKEAENILATVGITADRMKEYPHQFSGGMKQRVLIAMALACKPVLLLADEPTTALDVTVQAQVLDMIQQLKEERHMAMLLITHDLGIVAENCDYVAVIYAGTIVEYGSCRQVFMHPMHPYTVGLFHAIPDLSGDQEWLTPIEGTLPDPTDLPPGCAFAPRCSRAEEECFHEIPGESCCEGHMYRCFHPMNQEGEK